MELSPVAPACSRYLQPTATAADRASIVQEIAEHLRQGSAGVLNVVSIRGRSQAACNECPVHRASPNFMRANSHCPLLPAPR